MRADIEKPRKLLILDDELIVAQTVALAAERHAFAVRISESPEAFFSDVADFEPSHVIIDLLMPGMDGVEVLRNLAARECDAKIIMMSGRGSKVLEAAQRVGIERGLRITGTLPKPFKPAELRALLDADAHDRMRNSEPLVVAEREVLLADIGSALQDGQFVLHYQPKIQLAGSHPVGVEALVRWQHPKFGLLAPDRFLPLIEQSGTMDSLTACVIDAGLAWLASVEDDALQLAINISAGSLTDVSFTDLLHERCTRFKVDPTRVILELTETTAPRQIAEVLDILTRVRLKGFQLSIDDFGTGYSSLVQLAQLPFSEIKIDKSFVSGLHSSDEARKIVAITIGLGKQLQLTTVAEGVEHAEQVHVLTELQCDQAQGYFFARPMDGDSARTWLREHR